MNYKKALTTELIGALHEQGRQPDVKLIQALLKRGAEVVPGLIEIVETEIGPSALDMLEAVAADEKVEWYQRAVACRVMTTIAQRHSQAYPRVTAFLRSLLPDPQLDWQAYGSYEAVKDAVDDPRIWTSVVGRLCDLRDPEAFDLIGQLFQAGLIDEMVIDPALYRQAYRKSGRLGILKRPIDLLRRYKRSRS